MSNTLTELIPTIYQALDVVSRELVGFIPAVNQDSSAARAAKGQVIRARVVPALAAVPIVPSGALPDPSGISYGYTDTAITSAYAVRVPWDQEEIRSVDDQAGYNKDAFAQAFRTLTNQIEADLAGLYIYASRAYGHAHANPFNEEGDLSDLAFTRQILEDNGAPQTDLQMVLNSGAMANLRAKQGIVFKANEAGGTEGQRTGNITQLEGFTLRTSGQVKKHTMGKGTGYKVNITEPYVLSYPVGTKDIDLDTGNGTMVIGDRVYNSDVDGSPQYIVGTALNAGTVSINEPGLIELLPNNANFAIANSYAANMAFSKSAIVLLARVPQRPEKDAALDVTIVTDPVSGLSYEIAVYGGYRKIWYEVAACWGVKAVKSAHMALLAGKF